MCDRNPATASPWLSLNLYNELLNEKGIYLSRGDFLNHLTKHVNLGSFSFVFDYL